MYVQNISRSLFSDHALVFSFILCVGILRGRGEFDDKAWALFLNASTGEPERVEEKPSSSPPDFISAEAWGQLAAAEQALEAMRGISADIAERSTKAWKNFCNSSKPFEDSLPPQWRELR